MTYPWTGGSRPGSADDRRGAAGTSLTYVHKLTDWMNTKRLSTCLTDTFADSVCSSLAPRAARATPALVPKPRVNLTRFHGVFAPNSKHRVQVTPAKRGKGSHPKAPDEAQNQTPAERRAAMTWAQRLKRVFRIEIEICPHGGGPVLQIFRESRRSNASFHVYRRSAGGRSRSLGRIERIARPRRSKIDPLPTMGLERRAAAYWCCTAA